MAKNEKGAEAVFSKRQLLAAKRFEGRRDALAVVLKHGEVYTIAQAERLLDAFMKKEVH